jgi:hypothetical protein
VTRTFATLLPELTAASPYAAGSACADQSGGLGEDHVEARIEEAYARGVADGTARANVAAEDALTALKLDHAEELDALRNEAGDIIAQQLSGALTESIERVGRALSEALVQAVGSLARSRLDEIAVQALATEINRDLSELAATSIRIEGPKELTDLLAERLRPEGVESDGPFLSVSHAETAEVRVEIDGALIETRIAEWCQRISEVLVQ